MKKQYFEMIRVLTKLDILRNEVFMCVCVRFCLFGLILWDKTSYCPGGIKLNMGNLEFLILLPPPPDFLGDF